MCVLISPNRHGFKPHWLSSGPLYALYTHYENGNKPNPQFKLDHSVSVRDTDGFITSTIAAFS